jgi:pimeloyl-ACP methyl ester carboxylesterase
LHYLEWGDPECVDTLVCVHGLTRNARDFDTAARQVAKTHRVVSVDVVGRGRSDRLVHPEDYAYPVYLQDMATLIGRLAVQQVDWLGTSMGGIIGMLLAAQPGSPIRSLVLNDVGAFIPAQALARINAYLSQTFVFDSLDAVTAHLRLIHAPFGPLSDQQWSEMARHSSTVDADGQYRLNYDPAIATPLAKAPLEDVDLWSVWEAIRCPTLVLRGAESDVLQADTAQAMAETGPGADVLSFPGIGHAPALLEGAQVQPLHQWLLDKRTTPSAAT